MILKWSVALKQSLNQKQYINTVIILISLELPGHDPILFTSTDDGHISVQHKRLLCH